MTKFGVMFDFRNTAQWRRPDAARYRVQLDVIAQPDELSYDHIWLTEHHFVEDGYDPSVLPLAATRSLEFAREATPNFHDREE